MCEIEYSFVDPPLSVASFHMYILDGSLNMIVTPSVRDQCRGLESRVMADFLEDDESDYGEHRFGHQEWDKLEENFVNVGQVPCF